MNGTYTPNEPGARNIREARPLYIGNDLVTAQVYELKGETRLSVFIGLKMIRDEKLPAEVKVAGDVNPWVVNYVADYLRGIQAKDAPVDYPKWTGNLQGKLDLIHVDVRTLLDIYQAELDALPVGALRLIADILEKTTLARRYSENPPKILPYK